MTPPRKPACLLIGGGGHAKVVIDAIRLAGKADRLAVLAPDPTLAGRTVLGVPVLGGDDKVVDAKAEGFDHFIVAVGSLSDNGLRRRLFEQALAWGLAPLTVIHPAAVVAASAVLGGGTVVLAGAVVNPEAHLGLNVIVNTGAIVEHDCRVGDHAHVATGARLLGGVTVGDLTLVGGGAVVRQGLAIGAAALIGAGAVVVKDVPAGIRVAGVPARSLP